MCAARKIFSSASVASAAVPAAASSAPDAAEASATPARATSSDFAAHLRRIRAAKRKADELLDSQTPLDAPEASLALVWEIVFDRLCSAADAELSEVGTLAGIVQKLFSTDAKRKCEAKPKTATDGISPEVLRKIEEKLKLL